MHQPNLPPTPLLLTPLTTHSPTPPPPTPLFTINNHPLPTTTPPPLPPTPRWHTSLSVGGGIEPARFRQRRAGPGSGPSQERIVRGSPSTRPAGAATVGPASLSADEDDVEPQWFARILRLSGGSRAPRMVTRRWRPASSSDPSSKESAGSGGQQEGVAHAGLERMPGHETKPPHRPGRAQQTAPVAADGGGRDHSPGRTDQKPAGIVPAQTLELARGQDGGVQARLAVSERRSKPDCGAGSEPCRRRGERR